MTLSLELEYLARSVSRTFGWIYFLSWSASFYPQPYKNYGRRTTSGTTADFPTANILGFTCLTISNGCLLFNPTVRSQYALRHPKSPIPTVRANDFVFAVHGTVLCMITWSQYATPWLWGFPEVEGQKATWPVKAICGTGSGLVLISTGWVVLGGGRYWEWLDVIYAAGYLKLILTILKYFPQVLHNYRRGSTAGWSINQILLDAIGGVLSLAQLFIDSSLQSDWRAGVFGNPIKLFLGNVSLCYDIIFILQHYVFFGPVGEKVEVGDQVVEEGEENLDSNLPGSNGVPSNGTGERERLLLRE